MASSVVALNSSDFFLLFFAIAVLKRIEQLKHSRITNLLLQLDEIVNDSIQFDTNVLRI